MNNIGLRNYSKNLIRDLPYGKAYINLCPAETNVITVIPLIEEMGINYVFNYLARNENGTMGKGGHVSLFRRIDSNNRVYNADFSVDQYSTGVENKETGLTLSKSPIDRYGLSNTYTLTDKNDNVIRYQDPFRDYPFEIVSRNNIKTTIQQTTGGIIVSKRNYSVFLSVANNGTIVKAEYKHNNKVLKTVNIIIHNGQGLDIEYCSPRGGKSTLEFGFENDFVSMIDKATGSGEKYCFSGSKIREIAVYKRGLVRKDIELFFDEENNVTTITDSKGVKEYFFFEKRLIRGKTYYFNSLYANDESAMSSVHLNDDFEQVYSFGYDNVALNNVVIRNQCVDIDSGDCGLYQNKTELEQKLFDTIDVCNPLSMDWSFNVSALGSDSLSLCCFVKALNAECEVTAELNGSVQTITVSNNWKLLYVKHDVTNTLKTVNIKFNSNGAVLITPFNVFKDDFANIYKYNDNNEMLESLASSISSNDGTKYNFRYNDDKELIGFTGPHGVRVSYDYTDHNITREYIMGECWRLDSYTYYQNDLPIHKHDGLTNIDYEYDNFDQLKTVSDAVSCVDVASRNAYGNITKLLLKNRQNEDESIDATYEYDSEQRLTKITLKNGTFYVFSYDNYSRLTSISLNRTCVFKYEYNENNQIKRQYFGSSSDYYEFIYSEGSNAVRAISHSGGKVRYEYEYDEYNRIAEVNEIRNGVKKNIETFVYDRRGAHVKTTNNTKELTKVFDNNGNTIRSIDKCSNKTVIQEYDVAGRSKSSSPEDLIKELSTDNGYSLAPYIGTYDCVGKEKTYQCLTIGQKLPDRPGINYDVRSVSSKHRIVYKLGRNWSNGTAKETFAFWFRSPRHPAKACLFKIDGENSNSGLAIYEKADHFELVKVDSNNNHTVMISTNKTLHYNTEEWNFISLSIYIDPANHSCRYELRVNTKIYVSNGLLNAAYLTSGELQIKLGYNVKGSIESSEFCDTYDCCYFALLAIWDPETENADILNFYKATKDYLMDNTVLDYSGVDYSITHLVKDTNTSFGSLKVFPLDNSVFSLDYDPLNENDLDKPYQLDARDGYSIDNDRFFNFSSTLKRYAFVADGNKLSFQTNISRKGTFAASFFLGGPNEKQFLFDARGTGTRLSLYRNINGQAIVLLNGNPVLNSNAKINSGWHNVAVTFDATNGSQLNILVIIDGTTYTYSFNNSTQIAIEEIMLGRSFYSETDNGGYQTYRPLFGQISNFAYSNECLAASTLSDYFRNIEGITKIKTYDDLGVVNEENIKKGNDLIMGKSYGFSTVGPQIQNEYFRFSNNSFDFERSYSYDEAGNVSGISDYQNGEQKETWYKYDYRGFLIEESSTDPDWSIAYTYDSNGNILTRTHGPRYEVCGYGFPPPTRPTSDRPVETDTFVYDSQSPDKLIRYNDKQIKYDSKSPGNISSIESLTSKKTFKYEGRRLVEAVLNERGSIETRIAFEYDDKGLRTSKTVAEYLVRFNKQTFQTTYIKMSETIHKYEYDGNDLIFEKINDGREIYYLYDESKQLYGYILNGEKYFYIKDYLHNILGVVDESGTVVARYNNDAYGNVLSSEGSVYNPIRYKGYYYDSELNMYYCVSRYYVPELCRWLNADNPNFLNKNDLLKNNLFAYCSNNPVMALDPDGHMPWWCKLLIGVAVIAVLAVATVVSAGVAGVGVGAAFAAGFAGAAIGTGVSGAVVTVAAGAFAGAVIGAVSGAVIGAAIGGITTQSWEGALEGAANGFMSGAITGAITGGIRAGINYHNTTPLYRTVNADEFNSLSSTKAFSTNGQMESKWLATTKQGVEKWAAEFGQNQFVGVRVPTSALSDTSNVYFSVMQDSIDDAYCIGIDYLNTIIQSLWFF